MTLACGRLLVLELDTTFTGQQAHLPTTSGIYQFHIHSILGHFDHALT